MTNFARTLKLWYLDNARDLPWRSTNNPYEIWLSEIILQQTQVKTGLPYFQRIVAKYPDVESLASANPDEFKRDWQGLGYYRRADNLLKAAGQIVTTYGGKFPETSRELQKLSGVGEYTAAAIASFSFNEPVPVIDGNVKRVISRLYGIDEDLTSSVAQKKLREVLESVFDKQDPSTFNQAIMEFGALVCKKSPDCDVCPFQSRCVAYEEKRVSEIPFRKKTAEKRERYFHYFLHVIDGKIAMRQRSENDIWSGLYEFPMLELESAFSNPDDILADLQHCLHVDVENLFFVRAEKPHVLSHQRINAFVFLLDSKQKIENAYYYNAEELEKLPKPRLISKILDSNEICSIIFPVL